MGGYTVIDVETTGLVPEKHDRVVEIGVVYVSHSGEVQGHWSTLVNPGRDVGPTWLHGVSATDVMKAPTFAEIAPHLLRAVTGRIMVGHNVTFDLRFLGAEFLRAGVPLRQLPLQGLCTMHWSGAFFAAPSRRLSDCCAACGIPLLEAHSAEQDALATAGLLGAYLRASSYRPPWGEAVAASRAYAWPEISEPFPDVRLARRAEVRAVPPDAWLDRIVARMPRVADPRVEAYLASLERALLDRFLAEHEKDDLIAVAAHSQLSRSDVRQIHSLYLLAMAEVAWEDGVVTDTERSDLDHVASVLGLAPGDVADALAQALKFREDGEAHDQAKDKVAMAGIRLAPGDRVVFTGAMGRERGEWEAIARARGLELGGVTKRTKLVVAADPNSYSGKAAKARNYGIPIVTEAAFERLLGGM